MAFQCPVNSPFDCLLLDLDDTLYPGGTGIGPALKRNIDEFLMARFGLAEDRAAALRVELFRTHGSTLAGLIALGHDVHPDEYHSYVHGRLPYDMIAADPRLAALLQSIPQRKIWEKVCLPKSAGGLGVLNLREKNKALLIKNLYKFFNQQDIPWVNLLWNAYYRNGISPVNQSNIGSFWWRSCLSFLEDFKRLTSCVPGNGKSVYLWEDKWQEGILKNKFPELHSFANNKMITVSKAKDLPSGQLRDYFALPLSEIAYDQCMILKDMINNLNISDDGKDVWKFPWNSDRYVTKKVYLEIIKPPMAPAPFKWIWKSPCLPKHKFFCWLMIQDRLNTRDLLSRKNFHVETTDCVLCDCSVRETVQHLLFACNFSKVFWEKIGVQWDITLPLIPMLIEASSRLTSPFFKVALIAGSWSLWNHRNKIIFDNEDRDQSVCFSFFKTSVELIRHRVKPSLRDGLLVWLDSL